MVIYHLSYQEEQPDHSSTSESGSERAQGAASTPGRSLIFKGATQRREPPSGRSPEEFCFPFFLQSAAPPLRWQVTTGCVSSGNCLVSRGKAGRRGGRVRCRSFWVHQASFSSSTGQYPVLLKVDWRGNPVWFYLRRVIFIFENISSLQSVVSFNLLAVINHSFTVGPLAPSGSSRYF